MRVWTLCVLSVLFMSSGLQADLVSYWKFDGDLLDSGPGGNHGTYGPATGTATFVAGIDGSALSLNGTSDFVRITQTTKFPAHVQPVFSMAFFVKGPAPTATPYDRKVFSEASTTSNTPLYNFGAANASGNTMFDPYIRTDANVTLLNHPKSVRPAFNNLWHHVVWIDNNGTVTVYIDGVKDTTNFNYTRAALTTNTATFGAIERAAVSNYLNAVLDEVRFYDHALTQEEVTALYMTNCPTEGDTTCTGLTVSGTPPAGGPGVYTFSASGSDVSGETQFLYNWVVKNSADITVFQRANATESSISIGLGAGTYTVSVTVDDDSRCPDTSPGATCTQTLVVGPDTPRLVSHWSLDGNANDSEASANHGTVVTGADATPPAFVDGFDGTPGGAIALSGDDYINVLPLQSLPIYVHPSFTIALWVKGLPQVDKRVYSEGSAYDASPLVNVGTDNAASPNTTGKVAIFLRNNSGAGTPMDHPKSERIAYDDAWHHVAWVDDGGWGSVYIDGVRDSVNVNYTRGILIANRVSLGGILRATAGNFFTGALDDVRVYNYALSAAEVSALVPEPAGCPVDGDTHATGVSVEGPAIGGPGTYTATATGTDDSGDPVLFTIVFKNSSGRILKQVGPGPGATASIDLAAGMYEVTVTADDDLACKDQAADAVRTLTFEVPAEARLEIANWLFSGTLVDGISGNAATFLGTGAPVYGEGADCTAGGALVLDGVEDLIQAGANARLPLTKKPEFAIAFWVKGIPQSDRRIFSESSSTDTNFLYNLGTDNTGATGSLDFYMRDGTGANPVNHLKSTKPVLDGTWHHVVWIDNRGVVTCYIDGVPDATSFSYARPPSLTQDITTLGGIYRPTRSPPASSWFGGTIDDVHLYNYALSEAEALALFAAPPTLCCPADGDTHCQGLTVEGPAGNKDGAYTATATAVDDALNPVLYSFKAFDGVNPPVLVGPQLANKATFNLSIGTWTISVAVDDDNVCPDAATDATCTLDILVTGNLQLAGDCNQSGKVDISDIVCGVNILFGGFNLLDRAPAVPPCSTAQGNLAVGSVNGDAAFNVSDIVYLASFLFIGGPPPVQGVGCFALSSAYGCPDNPACQ